MCTSKSVNFNQISEFFVVLHTLYLLYCFLLVLVESLLQLVLLINHTLGHLHLYEILRIHIFFGDTTLVVQLSATLRFAYRTASQIVGFCLNIVVTDSIFFWDVERKSVVEFCKLVFTSFFDLGVSLIVLLLKSFLFLSLIWLSFISGTGLAAF